MGPALLSSSEGEGGSGRAPRRCLGMSWCAARKVNVAAWGQRSAQFVGGARENRLSGVVGRKLKLIVVEFIQPNGKGKRNAIKCVEEGARCGGRQSITALSCESGTSHPVRKTK